MRSSLALLVTGALVLTGCAESPEPDGAGGITETPTAATESPSPSPSPTTASPSPTATPEYPAAPEPQTQAQSPEVLAQRITTAEQLIRNPELPADVLTDWAHVQQAAYRQLATRAEWHEPVLAGVPEELRDAARHNLNATIELRKLTEPRESLPEHWTIVEPPPAELLLDAYKKAGEEFGIGWTYLAAIHLVETRMGRIRGDSTAGARGPMQFIPSTWEAYGEGDIMDPHDAIRAAARYLAAAGAPEDMDGALWAYNHSDRYVQAVSDHAAVMREDPITYHAYHQWQVYYRLTTGDVVLEAGWSG